MEKIEITFDPQTRALQITTPKDLVLALGLLEYAHESVLFQVRSTLMPRVLAPSLPIIRATGD